LGLAEFLQRGLERRRVGHQFAGGQHRQVFDPGVHADDPAGLRRVRRPCDRALDRDLE